MYTVWVGDQGDVLFLEKMKHVWDQDVNIKGIDIIIDDGSHWNKHMRIFFIPVHCGNFG